MADSISVIGQGTSIRGNVSGDGDLQVAGQIEGTVNVSGELTVESSAAITGDTTAARVVARGVITGDIRAADAIIVEGGAKILGDLCAPRIAIEEGAMVRGRIETAMTDLDEAPVAAKAVAAAPVRQASRLSPQPAMRAPVAKPAERNVQAPLAPAQAEAEPVAIAKPAPVMRQQPANTPSPAAPPAPVVPALKKKTAGTLRKRGNRE